MMIQAQTDGRFVLRSMAEATVDRWRGIGC